MASVTPLGDGPRDPLVAAARREGISLGVALSGHRNALGIIRLALAALVIFDHAFPLGGFGEDPFWRYTRGQTSLGGIAVGGFFAVSGYLIVKSGAGADILQFVWRRVIRIFPAFWGVLAFGAFVVGPIAWVLGGRSLGTYLTLGPGGPLDYITANWTLTIGRYGIHDLFLGTPYGQTVQASVLNGSLWTLAYEWGCYMMVAVLAVSALLVRARIVVPILTGLIFILQIAAKIAPDQIGAIAPLFADPQVLFLASAFLVGSTIGIYSDKVPYDDRMGITAAGIFVVSMFYGGFAVFGVIAGGYFVLYLAARLPRAVQWIGAKNDYSYGVYVYGFLVQQCLAALGVQRFGYGLFALAALPVTFALAWLSWHGIEKHALALKSWGPGRGLHHWWTRIRGFGARGAGRPTNVREKGVS